MFKNLCYTFDMSKKNNKPNKILTDREKLELLYVKFLKLSHKTISMKFDYITEAGDYIKKALAKYMFKLYNFTELPQVVSDEEYEKLQARELFRGMEKIDYHAELLCSEDYYKSFCQNGIGAFCTTISEYAEKYTLNHGEDYVLKFKYTGKTLDRINDTQTYYNYCDALQYGIYGDIRDENIIKKCQIFRDFINDKESDVPNVKGIGREYAKNRGKSDFLEMIIADNNSTFMLIYLGFDCFDLDFDYCHRPETVIENRGKMVVSLSEYNRICMASEKYKNCVKTENDLNNEEQEM